MEQTESTIVDENLPASQLVQSEAPFCEYVPMTQFMQTEDAAAEKVPAVQLVHAALPMVFLYELMTHCVQAPSFCPVNPVLHKQLLETVLPVRLMSFTGQLTHEETPVMSLYLPASHKTHMLKLTLAGGVLLLQVISCTMHCQWCPCTFHSDTKYNSKLHLDSIRRCKCHCQQ